MVWLASLIVVTLCYYDTNITFLRAESGWFQFMSREEPSPHYGMMRQFFTNSSHGHYIPFAFYTEFELTYLIGPRETFWKWRQLGAVSILATCFFFFTYSVARIHRIRPWGAVAAAAGVSGLYVFQPLMRELIAWPFLVLPVAAAVFSTLALYALVQWVKKPTTRQWIWLAVTFSYLSMHLVGYGLATVLATTAVLGAGLAGIYSGQLKEFFLVRRTLLIALITMLLFAGMHGACMQFLRAAPLVRSNGPPADILSMLVFFVSLFLSAVRALISFDPPLSVNDQLPASLWPWGLLLLIVAASSLILMARSCLRRPTPERLSQFTLHCFSIVAFCGFVLMAIARYLIEPDSSGFHNFLLGSRYLVPANLLLFGTFAAITVRIARLVNLRIFLFIALGLAALVASRQFGATEYKRFYSGGAISHGKSWRSIVSLSRECRAANLPVPNVPMGALTGEFYDWDLKLYEPLLRYSLHLAPAQKIEFEDWQKVRSTERKKYEAVAPSLNHVISLLKL